MSATAEMIKNYSEVRARLYGKPVRYMALSQEVLERPQAVSWPVPEIVPVSAPLDMLKLPSWRFLVALAAIRNDQEASDILGTSRSRDIVKARHEAVYLITLHTPHSIARIGEFFGRDHTTLLNSLKKFPYIDRANRPSYAKDRPMPKEQIEGFPKDATLLETIAHGYEKAIPTEQIAKIAGVTSAVIRNTASKAKIRHPNARQYRPKSKLDWVAEDQE